MFFGSLIPMPQSTLHVLCGFFYPCSVSGGCRGMVLHFRKLSYLCNRKGSRMRLCIAGLKGNQVRTLDSSRCCKFLFPVWEDRRRRHSLPLVNDETGKASLSERVRRPAFIYRTITLCGERGGSILDANLYLFWSVRSEFCGTECVLPYPAIVRNQP